MESKGIPNKIHVSEATAKALVALGKHDWLTMRDGQIDVKGKGLMQTYFAEPVNDTAGRTRRKNGSIDSQLTSSSEKDRGAEREWCGDDNSSVGGTMYA
jgi:hypothetical protein